MKTILFKTIDGHEIIIGVDRPTIDPVETAKVVNEILKTTPEHQAAEAKKAEYAEAVRQLNSIKTEMKSFTPSEMRKAANKNQDKWNTALGEMAVRQRELKPLALALADKIISLRREHAVYFEPRAGEIIKTVAEVEALVKKIKALKPGTVLALNGSVVQDNRGAAFYRKAGGKWVHGKIVRLGDKVPSDAVLEDAVTDTQRDEIKRDRILALPESAKAAERAVAETDAVNAATGMRGELEIKSDSKALEKSQESYKAEMVRIDKLYG